MKRRDLINQYVEGWRMGDIDKILAILTSDCMIVESHGPMYKNKKRIKEWIDNWNKSGSKVDKWNVKSYFEIDDVAFFEWNFTCTVDNKQHQLEGISFVKFKNGKISFMREYRTTKTLYLSK